MSDTGFGSGPDCSYEPVKSERPKLIAMSGVMMQATLEDRKTKTRRVIVPQPLGVEWFQFQKGWCARVREDGSPTEPHYEMLRCPYGQPGQILIARATWAVDKSFDRYKPRNIPLAAVKGFLWIDGTGPKPAWAGKSRPGRFAPRALWECFPKLRLEAVAVERVQHISDADIAAEGVQYPVKKSEVPGKVAPLMRLTGPFPPHEYMPAGFHQNYTHEMLMRAHFASLWDTINAARGYPWSSNPWVWCLTFSRVTA